MGHAAVYPQHAARLRPRCAKEPRGGPADHAEARLRSGQAARGDSVHAQYPPVSDPAVILIDQLKEIYIDGVLEPILTVNWYPKVARKDYTVGLSISENSLDEPDQSFYENYVCGAEHNYSGYCNPE